MKTILFLSLCLGLQAAPLPPFPGTNHPPVIPTFRPASVNLATVGMTLTKDFNFFHCDTNDVSCVLYDILDLTAGQHAGSGTAIEFCENLGDPWVSLITFDPGPGEYLVGFTWFYESTQRPPARFFRARVIGASYVPAGFKPGYHINPAIRGTILPRFVH